MAIRLERLELDIWESEGLLDLALPDIKFQSFKTDSHNLRLLCAHHYTSKFKKNKFIW